MDNIAETREAGVSSKPESDQLTSSVNVAELEKKAQWLSASIQEGLDRSRKKRDRFRSRASIIKIGTIVLSGTVTILLGLQIAGLEDRFRMVAFVLGAIVTMLAALEPFFNFRSLWVEHEETVYRLYRLQDDLNFYLTGKQPTELSLEKLEGFNQRYGQIWVNLSERWLEYRRSESRKETA
jgi:hypothetical protein